MNWGFIRRHNMEKHEFSKIICDGIKKRKSDEAKRRERDFSDYICNRSVKIAREHSRLRK